jgi:hypothetical protein
MSIKKEGASAKAPVPTKNIKLASAYQKLSPEAREKAIERIAKRRADMPKIYWASYDRAVSGKSLRAAINSFCLECCMWERGEVRRCTSPACPLYAVRPYQGSSKNTSERPDFAPESEKSEDKGNG